LEQPAKDKCCLVNEIHIANKVVFILVAFVGFDESVIMCFSIGSHMIIR